MTISCCLEQLGASYKKIVKSLRTGTSGGSPKEGDREEAITEIDRKQFVLLFLKLYAV
jgi:hypothetical protein